MNVITVNTRAVLQELYDDSALTIEGLVANEQGLSDLFTWIKKYTDVKRDDVYVISGSLMNMAYGLTGDNAYPEDLSIVCVKLSDLEDPLALTMPRFQIGGRWFDDVVANNQRRENEKKGMEDEEG